MKVLVIDNNDSFTYNLVHILEKYANVDVVRYMDIDIENSGKWDKLLISPGPGLASDYEKNYSIIDKYHKQKSILGICLGHQIIGNYFGLELFCSKEVWHGKKMISKVIDFSEILFQNVPEQFYCGRYHSWLLKKSNNNSNIKITAIDEFGNIMAIKHSKFDVTGIQFHPESIMSDYGEKIISNWVKK